ncbi:MAG TPA: hypothetical protein VES73_08000 [Lamprocystis sp. (in: g-proteobacteria)]|nr:hypothetical protein [Lamprocystis sp. (in: g-proteobacteria)]
MVPGRGGAPQILDRHRRGTDPAPGQFQRAADFTPDHSALREPAQIDDDTRRVITTPTNKS